MLLIPKPKPLRPFTIPPPPPSDEPCLKACHSEQWAVSPTDCAFYFREAIEVRLRTGQARVTMGCPSKRFNGDTGRSGRNCRPTGDLDCTFERGDGMYKKPKQILLGRIGRIIPGTVRTGFDLDGTATVGRLGK